MTPKTVFGLWVASAILLAGMAGSHVFTRIGATRSRAVFLAASDPAGDITEISIESLTERILLKKRQEGWMMLSPEEYPADAATVEALIKALGSARIEDKIGGVEKASDFDLDDARALKLTVKNKKGRTLAEGKVGKAVAGNFQRCYYWPEGSRDIYTLLLPRYQLDLKAAVLKDRVILSVSKDKIASLEIRRGREILSVIPIADSWKINGRQGREEKVAEIITALNRLDAVDFVSASELSVGLKKFGLEKEPKTLTLTVNLTEGKSYVLLIGERRDSYYFAKLAAKPTVWRVAEWNVAPMLVPLKELTLAPPPVSKSAPSSKRKR